LAADSAATPQTLRLTARFAAQGLQFVPLACPVDDGSRYGRCCLDELALLLVGRALGSASTMCRVASEVRTFVLTDLVGSTALWDDEPKEMGAALERHDLLVEEVVVAAGGDLIRSKGEGDSTFSVFADPVAAVVAAADVVAELRRTAWPTASALTVRVGVHVGATKHRAGTGSEVL
jgi:class 3 adenylate cyclase